MDELISKQAAIDVLKVAYFDEKIQSGKDDPCVIDAMTDWSIRQIKALPSAQPEVIPHRNYKYLSDYWCECGWHLGKKGEVKYCSECGRKVNWDG